MPHIELRAKKGDRSPTDLAITVQDKTFAHLMTTISPEIRISAFLDRDCPRVEAIYEEVFVAEECPFETLVAKIIPGSRTRKNIELPGPMNQGEQLTIIVERKSK